jgi:hypothetical protein
MLCNKLVFNFMYEAFLFGKRIENLCYAHAMRMRGLYVSGTGGGGGLLHMHCMLSEDYSCPVDIIYVVFYPPVLHMSADEFRRQVKVSAAQLSSPSNFLCCAYNYS